MAKSKSKSIRLARSFEDEILLSVKSWLELTGALSSCSSKEKGDVFERLVQLYLLFDPIYDFEYVWKLDELPEAHRRKLGLVAADKGIDLIAKDKSGYIAVQAKYVSQATRSISWTKLSTFIGLAFGVSKQFNHALVCTTAHRITDVLDSASDVSTRTSEVWNQLGKEFFKFAHATIKQKPLPKLVAKKPRPHQKRAVKDSVAYFLERKSKRGKLILPCGAGKSLTAYWIAKELNSKSILVVVPTLALVQQTLTTWLREFNAHNEKADWLFVCSDDTAGKPDPDSLTCSVQELGVQRQTNPELIAKWLRKRSKRTKVLFTTYHSGKLVSQAARLAKVTMQLAIFDEAHKTVGQKDKAFSHLLFDSNIKIKRRLFMTATERRYRGSSSNVVSMDDEDVYGDTIHLLTFKEALQCKRPQILCDYRILTVAVTQKQVRELIQDRRYVKPDSGEWADIDAASLAAVVALNKASESYPISHSISFHRSIQRAKAFKEHCETYASLIADEELDVFHVNGQQPTAIRRSKLRSFEDSQNALLTNARCLTEGVDVPKIDCVLFADPKRSRVDIVQSAGRAMRPSPGKDKGVIILPLVLDEGEGLEDVMESSSFRWVLGALRDLASNDERIVEYFRSVSEEGRSDGGVIDFEFSTIDAQTINLEKFEEAIHLACWQSIGPISPRPFKEARKFVRELGLDSSIAWREYCLDDARPPDIPTNPHRSYRNTGWLNWGDWLGTGRQSGGWRAFSEARDFARSLSLESSSQWRKFCQGKLDDYSPKPADIPAEPAGVYEAKGWVDWADWLDSEYRIVEWRPFEEARKFARGLGVTTAKQWSKFCRGELPEKGVLPADIPKAPQATYKEWQGFADWFGKELYRNKGFRDFESARKFVHSLNLKPRWSVWKSYCKGEIPDLTAKPKDIPSNPNRRYAKSGWAGIDDWLGGYEPVHTWRSFVEAREFARSLRLPGTKEWNEYCSEEVNGIPSKPSDIPKRPNNVYLDDGWINWADWLGKSGWRDFESARSWVHTLNFSGQKDWFKWIKGERPDLPSKPDDIPTNPSLTYKDDGWKGYGDWLGTGRNRGTWRDFKKARRYARSLKLASGAEWSRFAKGELPDKGQLPADIPKAPQNVYDEWKGLSDWLGTTNIAPRWHVYRDFEAARTFARGLGLTNVKQWQLYTQGKKKGLPKLPSDIPATPDQTYRKKGGWVSYPDWLGSDTRSNKAVWMDFADARLFARGLGLESIYEWRDYVNGKIEGKPVLPLDIPKSPDGPYKRMGVWVSWPDWLANEYPPFSEAKVFASSLGLTCKNHWARYCEANLESNGRVVGKYSRYPDGTYNNDGWTDWVDYLEIRKFVSARAFARKLGLKTSREWKHYCDGKFNELGSKPADIPAKPNRTYKQLGWVSWEDWLFYPSKRQFAYSNSIQINKIIFNLFVKLSKI